MENDFYMYMTRAQIMYVEMQLKIEVQNKALDRLKKLFLSEGKTADELKKEMREILCDSGRWV